jgi:hypothetical protein
MLGCRELAHAVQAKPALLGRTVATLLDLEIRVHAKPSDQVIRQPGIEFAQDAEWINRRAVDPTFAGEQVDVDRSTAGTDQERQIDDGEPPAREHLAHLIRVILKQATTHRSSSPPADGPRAGLLRRGVRTSAEHVSAEETSAVAHSRRGRSSSR